MSADAWEDCVFCSKNDKKKLKDSYGKIPQKEYEKLKKELSIPEGATVRLDYEVAIVDGELYINASAQCQTCGATWSFKKSIKANK